MWVVYQNTGKLWKQFITCTTEDLAESQLNHNQKLGRDVVMLGFNRAKDVPYEISVEHMAKILEAKIHA